MRARLEFKAQDMWIGAYWDRGPTHYHLWVCLLPMLPIHIWWSHMPRPSFPGENPT
jgi:hypothetical protein